MSSASQDTLSNKYTVFGTTCFFFLLPLLEGAVAFLLVKWRGCDGWLRSVLAGPGTSGISCVCELLLGSAPVTPPSCLDANETEDRIKSRVRPTSVWFQFALLPGLALFSSSRIHRLILSSQWRSQDFRSRGAQKISGGANSNKTKIE